MKPAPFTYAAPESVDEVIALLDAHGGDAKLLAGGQSLTPMMNLRLASPAYVIDLNRLEGFEYMQERDGFLAIGAMTRQRHLERSALVRQHYPLLAEAARLIGHPATRNRGTVGGSIAHADPAAELPALLLTYGGSVIARGAGGDQEIPAEDFFVSYFTTALEPGELLTEVRLRRWPEGTGWCFLEESRRYGDYAVAGVAALMHVNASGRCDEVAVTVFGVGDVPYPVGQAASLLVGQVPSEERLAAVGQAAAEGIEPEDDVHASAAFRRHLSAVLTHRALRTAADRAG
ncbi:MAG: hypothetical protein ETSY1_16990 [Candidatus Entotheonella factor]|uniref:FAD-binding PCMH-type domain-containing protein n=1 Tax=Entotheonella factor TaxID=1429438 RepID=W4LMG9_ENTF1|nr:xanthine dehydrogenase family protein subunit M [Candidatus Entotheonella palauensis]ETW98890.1 MAG: hypothetical protein ETSY1_16990 [Candidatus Entotheonella factor]